MFKYYIRIGLIFIFLLLFPFHNFACNKHKIKQATQWFFGIDYPWWFSYSQAYVESNCIWYDSSLDGLGSIGYFQITSKYWHKELIKAGFKYWYIKDHTDAYMAHAYILHKLYKYIKKKHSCFKLYLLYQCYNRTCYRVLRENPRCCYKNGYKRCLEKYDKKVCVWQIRGKCKQYRSSCKINYNYSLKVFKLGQKFKEFEPPSKWSFW